MILKSRWLAGAPLIQHFLYFLHDNEKKINFPKKFIKYLIFLVFFFAQFF